MSDNKKIKPTEIGNKMHLPNGYYDGYPCTCKKSCLPTCRGHCGCKACHTSYMDFLSGE